MLNVETQPQFNCHIGKFRQIVPAVNDAAAYSAMGQILIRHRCSAYGVEAELTTSQH